MSALTCISGDAASAFQAFNNLRSWPLISGHSLRKSTVRTRTMRGASMDTRADVAARLSRQRLARQPSPLVSQAANTAVLIVDYQPPVLDGLLHGKMHQGSADNRRYDRARGDSILRCYRNRCADHRCRMPASPRISDWRRSGTGKCISHRDRATWPTRLLRRWQLASQGVAALTAGVIGLALSLTLSKADLAAWGWRVPFLLSLLLVPVGLYLRSKMPETLDHRPVETGSWGVTLGKQGRLLLLSVLIILGGTVSTYVGNYMTTYAIATLHFQPSTALAATVVGGLATTVFCRPWRLAWRHLRPSPNFFPLL